MTTIAAVGSLNPVKVQAVSNALEKCSITASVLNCAAPSDVSAQPMTAEETWQGSRNRARAARAFHRADLGFGLEGGLMRVDRSWYCIGFATVVTNDGHMRSAMSPGVWVPPAIMDLVEDGMELGDAEDKYFARTNSKQSSGLIGIITGGIIQREETFYLPVITALCSLNFGG